MIIISSYLCQRLQSAADTGLQPLQSDHRQWPAPGLRHSHCTTGPASVCVRHSDRSHLPGLGPSYVTLTDQGRRHTEMMTRSTITPRTGGNRNSEDADILYLF